jgi:hypothetical protein
VDANHTETGLVNNHIMSAQTRDLVLVDANASVNGAVGFNGAVIQGNNLYSGSATPINTTGMNFSTASTITNSAIGPNHFWQLNNKVIGTKGTMGSVNMEQKTTVLLNDQTTASTTFTNVTDGTVPVAVTLDANSLYFFNCEVNFASNSLSTGAAFAVTGPASTSLFAYIVRLPTIAIETGAGTDSMTEQEARGDDGLGGGPGIAASLGVASTSAIYTAAVRGNIVTGASTGNLQLRVRAEAPPSGTGGTITIKRGSNCMINEMAQ